MNKKLKTGLLYAALTIIGAIGGGILGKYIMQNEHSIMELIYALVWLFVANLVGVVVHESGHLVCGRKTGYEFVSFRIGSMTWIRENGKLVRKKFSIHGTAGQCILMPPEVEHPEDMPFALYFLGGGLFNLISAAIFLPIGILIPNYYVSIPVVFFGGFSLLQGIINLVPLQLTVPNDGYQILNLCRHKEERVLIYKQLRFNGLLYQGLTPSEIPEELYDFGEDSRGLSELIQATRYLDCKDFQTAERLVASSIDSGKMISLHELEAKSELLFCKIMNGASESEINALYDKELKKYIAASAKTQIAKRRTMYAYDLMITKDMEAAGKEYDAAMAMKQTYPCAGELKSELALIEYVGTKCAA
ncbi:MAG: M50 family metallopeptidase [Lachnospiraceae bacterium]|nr:M50 family metallopeptidase [Lachnospiraceae bacterium]